MAMNIIFNRSRPLLLRTLKPIFSKPISTSPFLSQQPQPLSPDPPTPAPSSQTSSATWTHPPGSTHSLVPLDFLQTHVVKLVRIAESLDLESIKELFADWMTLQKWHDMKKVFEHWSSCYDKNGKLNKPDVGLYNHYLRANLMLKASPSQLLELVSGMESLGIHPNTASFNLILKTMYLYKEVDTAVQLLDRMIESEKETEKGSEQDVVCRPDDESFDLVVGMLLQENRMEAAFKYIDLNLKYGHSMSSNVFSECVFKFMASGSLDTLVSVIERCKKMDQNKALRPEWKLCLDMLDCAMKADNSELAYYALEFMAKWMIQDENMRPPRYLSVEEGLVVSLLATAGRTYSKKLLDAAWTILKRSLRKKRVANAETYLARIHAHASLGTDHLKKAFGALHEFESLYGGADKQAAEDLFSPFTALYPLVVACSHNGFATLDSVYFQLENLSKANPPYKSLAALNCIILGCANIWDVHRASETFTAISTTFGLTPDVNSYNGLICAYGKLNKRKEALELFEQLKSLGIKPNAMTYALLVDAHLVAKDPKSALSIIDEMVISGYTPTKAILKKVRRRCIREMDYESNDQVEDLAKKFGIRMGTETRRNLLFNLQYTADYVQER
ncbi:hypothetical protein ACET3Z_029346 [Daucus carota]